MVAAADAAAIATYRAGHEAAVLLDSGDRPYLRVTGSARARFLHRITTADINALQSGQIAPTLLITGKGRLLDRLMVLCLEDSCLVLGSAGAGDLPAATLRRYVVFDDVQIDDLRQEVCLLALHGPEAGNVLAAAGGETVIGEVQLAGIPVTQFREPGPGGTGWLILADSAQKEGLIHSLQAAAGEGGLVSADPVGWEALRVETGLLRFGHELTEDWNPLEMRQEDALSFDKGCYVGQEVMARLRTYDRVKRRLWRISFAGGVAPSVGTKVHAAPGEGVITSSARVPGEDRSVVLAVLPGDDPAPGGEVIAMTPEGERLGEIVGAPPTATDMRVAPPANLGKRRFDN